MKTSVNKNNFRTYSFVINEIQVMNEYYWRYQRYELIREYFEKPKFAFPPLTLLVYILMLIRLVYRQKMVPRVFSKFSITTVPPHFKEKRRQTQFHILVFRDSCHN